MQCSSILQDFHVKINRFFFYQIQNVFHLSDWNIHCCEQTNHTTRAIVFQMRIHNMVTVPQVCIPAPIPLFIFTQDFFFLTKQEKQLLTLFVLMSKYVIYLSFADRDI